MKACMGLFFAAVVFGVLAPIAKAQDVQANAGDLVPQFYVPDLPERPLVPARATDPRFTLHAEIVTGQWKYNGNHEYKGAGFLKLTGQADQDLPYHFRCAYSFRVRGSQIYQARWLKPGEKLEILMSKPGSNRIKRCDLNTHG